MVLIQSPEMGDGYIFLLLWDYYGHRHIARSLIPKNRHISGHRRWQNTITPWKPLPTRTFWYHQMLNRDRVAKGCLAGKLRYLQDLAPYSKHLRYIPSHLVPNTVDSKASGTTPCVRVDKDLQGMIISSDKRNSRYLFHMEKGSGLDFKTGSRCH